MGKVFKKIDKAAGKLIGIDKDGAKEAANAQAKATKEASEAVARDALYAAQANQNAIEATQAQNAARAKAQDLLGRPMETAEVDLANTDDPTSDDDADLLGRKRGGIRQTYRRSASANSGLVL